MNTKDIDPIEITLSSVPHTLEQAAIFRTMGLEEYAARLEEKIAEESNVTEKYLRRFITCDDRMLKLKEQVRILAKQEDPVLIIGETGTGKELIAQALHGNRKGKFLPVNCAGMPEQLIEAELFGYTKGSFTGAVSDREGLLEAAKDGTIFLDEIGDMPMPMQAKLLRALQEGKIRRVGDTKERDIYVRFVCATHHPLQDNVKKKLFREDLYWRISTFLLQPTELKHRLADIKLIVADLDEEGKLKERMDEFVQKITVLENGLSGNVRSLQQYVRRYYVLGVMP